MQHVPYWNITGGLWIDLVAVFAVAALGYGIYRHWLRIRNGEADWRFSIQEIKAAAADALKAADWKRLAIGGLLGSRVYRDRRTGLYHGLVFWGMLILFIGTTLVVFNVYLGLPVMSGPFYKWGMAFGLDAAGLALLVGLICLLGRRLDHYPRVSQPSPRPGFVLVELALIAIVGSGFMLEGLRLLAQGTTETAFVGNLAAALMVPLADNALIIHRWLWWIHGTAAMGLIAAIPFSPLVHIVLVPVNAALSDPYMGTDTAALDLEDMDLEEIEDEDDMPSFGAATIADFAPDRRLDATTCLWCGRCQEVCPAARTEKRLSPKGVVTTLARFLAENRTSDERLIDTISQEVLFECRTCGACVEACPGFVNPIKSIWQMRRHLVMDRGEMPDEVIQLNRNMEAMMHPFAASIAPDAWRKDLEVPIYQAGQTEYLLWIGCAVTYEDRAQSVGRAMVNILNRCGISYGIIEEARCTGDPAKQLGDDFMFSMMANANIELFNAMGVKKIITMCPHCYNSFRNYYPPLGATYELIPHAELLRDLIRKGKIDTGVTGQTATYHDPCYLGRHNRIFDAPRSVVGGMATLKEMDDHHANSFCCGAGGGNYWIEEAGQRINQARSKQAHATGSDMLVSSCPFCLLMLTDGMKNFSETTEVLDIAELVDRQMKP